MTALESTPLLARSQVAAALVLSSALLTVAGCGTTAPASDGSGGQRPISARALAAVVEDHLAGKLGHATSARPSLDGGHAVGGVAAELRYRAEGEPTAPGVWIAVGTKPGAAEFTCKALTSQSYAGCVTTDGGVLFWEEQAPEEDPGVVYVALRKGHTTVLMSMTGPDITKDPRKLDLRISVEDLFGIAKDDRVGETTSASAVHAGETLKSWTDHG